MKNYLEALQYKKSCLDYHYDQAIGAAGNLNHENTYILMTHFCSMMEAISSCIDIARSLAYNQSPVDAKTFFQSLSEQVVEELNYIGQFVIASRNDCIFIVSDELDISIKPIVKKRERGYFNERNLISYLHDVKSFSEKIISDFTDIYFENTRYYDQSWRTVDINRSSFSCVECGAIITEIMSHIGNLSGISSKEKASFLPRLTYVYGHEVIKAGLLPWSGSNEITEDEVIIPIDSLYSSTTREPAPGCCGPDSSTMNMRCSNGHPVGKEAADCYMPHFIRFPMDRITKSEILDG